MIFKLFLIALKQIVSSIEQPTALYANNATLMEPDVYLLYWNFTESDIIFEIHVKTNGWAGFGISPNGGMSSSNAIVTWINVDGSVNFTDRHLVDHAAAVINRDQQWLIYLQVVKMVT